MLSLDDLLNRPGLPHADRLLIRAKVAIWPGDNDTLADCIRRYRELGQARSDLEEVLLQAILFCGFPRVINAFRVLSEQWPTQASPSGGGVEPNTQRSVGDALFRSIYSDNTAAVEAMLLSYHEELHEFVLDTAYGRILSRPGLAPRIRELLAIGVLALTDQSPQLLAHGRGAAHFGATTEEIREAIYTGIEQEDYAEAMSRKIQRI
jgi:AhpD family alkylhydroperoxidase